MHLCALSLTLLLALVGIRADPPQTADLRVRNSCGYTLWIEARGGDGPIPGQSSTLTQLTPNNYVDYTMPSAGLASTRFWAKYGCDSTGNNCAIGNQVPSWPSGSCGTNGCTPPIDSLFEATWGCKNSPGCSSSTTFFDTSQVDGYTLPYFVTLKGDTSKCDVQFLNGTMLNLSDCPSTENLSVDGQYTHASNGNSLTGVDLRVLSPNGSQVVGCSSPCTRMSSMWQQPVSSMPTLYMCCPTPDPNNCQESQGCILPAQCKAGPVVSTQYVQRVHEMAPGIYAYAYDDGNGGHACPAGSVVYEMEFCPAGSPAYPVNA